MGPVLSRRTVARGGNVRASDAAESARSECFPDPSRNGGSAPAPGGFRGGSVLGAARPRPKPELHLLLAIAGGGTRPSRAHGGGARGRDTPAFPSARRHHRSFCRQDGNPVLWAPAADSRRPAASGPARMTRKLAAIVA